MIASLSVCAVAIIFESAFGYPHWLFRAIGHPVTWTGAALAALDRHLNRETDRPGRRCASGVVALTAVLALCGSVAYAISFAILALLMPLLAIPLLGLLASTCLAQRSLDQHVGAVANALDHDGLGTARKTVGAIVGRDTSVLDEVGIARAAIESLAENFADGVVAPAFWLALLGLPGAVLYKAVNTADSMIGHRTPRHAAFGFAAAKVDDLVNWLPARIAALWLVAAAAIVPDASPVAAWRVMRRDANGHPSPNAGWPEAAMAGAIDIRLGGPRSYNGQTIADAFIGDGNRPASAAAIRAALRVYRTACLLQALFVALLALLIAQW